MPRLLQPLSCCGVTCACNLSSQVPVIYSSLGHILKYSVLIHSLSFPPICNPHLAAVCTWQNLTEKWKKGPLLEGALPRPTSSAKCSDCMQLVSLAKFLLADLPVLVFYEISDI